MRVFVYEFVTAGGTLAPGHDVPRSLLREGSAMVEAVARDFGLLADVDVLMMRDASLPAVDWHGYEVVPVGSEENEQATFRRLAAEAEAVLLIAPETGGELLRRCQFVEALGRELLSPGSECVALAGDKQMMAERLATCGVPVPRGRLLRGDRFEEDEFPLVVKPVDGCGSAGVRLVREAGELAALPADGSLRVERYVPGIATGVSVVCGPSGCFALPACEQRLSGDGRFAYLGGRLPLAAELDERARELAMMAARALPEARGYIGVDLVLGKAADGSQDYVIEINPRLTTSYIGLRAASQMNLAAAMVDACRGRRPDLCFDHSPLEFDADGCVRALSRTCP